MVEINQELADKVLEIVDQGLCSGLGVGVPGNVCVEAAVCLAMGLPNSDDPPCVGPAVRAFKIRLNDSAWSSNEERAKGMRRLAIAQLGSDGVDQVEFAKGLARLAESWADTSATAVRYAATSRSAVSSPVGSTVRDAAGAAAAAAYAAGAAAGAADRAYACAYARAYARDEFLSRVAEDVVQLLIKLESPGCKFLD